MTLLLLAGTTEAKRIAWGLTDTGVSVTASLAGVTRHPEPLPVPTRVGGFGGEDGFRAYLAENKVHAVLDATHPFASRISDRTARVCAALGLPYAQVVRPAWTPQTGDRWTMIAEPREAADHIPDDGTVFLATGRQTLADYATLQGRRVLARMVDGPTAPFPFDGGEFIIGRPPFKYEAEIALFKALGVTHLVAKNAGGDGGRPKLDAARALNIPVVMQARPTPAGGIQLDTVQDALIWAAAQ